MKKSSYFSGDIAEFLFLLAKHNVRYLIVGGEAVIYYGYARLTGDIDLYWLALVLAEKDLSQNSYLCTADTMNTQNIQIAVNQLRKRLALRFGDNVQLYLFGSVARGNYKSDSDIDVLVLVDSELTPSQEEDIFDIAYDIELEYDVVFGVIAYSKGFWTSPRARSMPLYENIHREGIAI